MSHTTLLCINIKKLILQFRWFWRQNCNMSWCACPCVLCDKTEPRLLLPQTVIQGWVSDFWRNCCLETEVVFWVWILLSAWVIHLFGVLLLIEWGFLGLLRKKCNFWMEFRLLGHRFQWTISPPFWVWNFSKAYLIDVPHLKYKWVCNTMINLKDKYFLKTIYINFFPIH